MDRLRLRSDGFEIETEMNLNAVLARLRIAKVPSLELGRRSGTSNLSAFHDGWQILRTLVKRRLADSGRRWETDSTSPLEALERSASR